MTIEKNQVHKALMAAFPNKSRLAVMLAQRFDVIYDDLAADDVRDVEYWSIVQQVDAEGWLAELARAGFETVPKNPEMGALAIAAGLTSLAPAAAAPVVAPGPVSAPMLQRMVREGGEPLDLPVFLARLSTLEGQVCRIEAPVGTPLGTGFLVGPDLVMTNHHVIADLIGTNTKAICRFDYLTDAQGIAVRPGKEVPFAQKWRVESVAYDPADISPADGDPPAPGMLDTAIIQLASAEGRAARKGEVSPENPPRGWIALDEASNGGAGIGTGKDVFILQHPLGAPLKLGLGRVSDLPWGGLRIRYDATTEKGSSGSPVLDSELRLVGLHHVGDPNAFRTAMFNQAVPLQRILPWLSAALPPPPFWEERP